MTDTLLAIGTRKGLFLARSQDDRRSWSGLGDGGPHFSMQEVYAVAIDTRRSTPRILVGADSPHWGPSVFTSDDLGASWQEPAQGAVRFPEHTGAALARVWQLRPGPASQPDVVWAGVEPSALFRSDDGGGTFSLVEGLWNHPHRKSWQPGGGGMAVHTVLPHPDDPSAVMVAMSTGGVYRSKDGGASWDPANSGIAVSFSPDPYPEFGQCVHKVAAHPARPDQLFAQNHGGVYRSEDGGSSWQSIGEGPGGLPSTFGFPVVVHPNRPGVAYLFPLVADADRRPVDSRFRVYRSEDAGSSWSALSAGLPQDPHYGTVLRDAMCTDDAEVAGVYVGDRNGEVYASRDEGESWSLVASHLPDVLCVRSAVVG